MILQVLGIIGIIYGAISVARKCSSGFVRNDDMGERLLAEEEFFSSIEFPV